ncbi:MAG: hypothetical protein ACFFB0_06340 [Promethearchaeota archaeon]
MPIGYVIIEWTEDEGLRVKLSHPEKLSVDLDDMMRVFYAHVTGAGEAGNVLVRLEKAHSNVSSYFTGMESTTPIMINLMLELGEDPDMFGEAVIQEVNRTILDYLNRMGTNISQQYEIIRELKGYLKTSLLFMERLKDLSKEQRLAQIYYNEKSRTILELLQDRALSRRELQAILEEKLHKIVANIEITIDPFIKTGLIKQDWVEGDTDITFFLQTDFVLMRTPVTKLIENAKKLLPTPELATKYLEKIAKFFKDYEPNLQDNLIIAQDMINPDKYDFITLLREKAYPLNKIPKGPGESVEEVGSFLRSLENDNIVTFIKDEKDSDWIFLLSDIDPHTFYPEYLIEKIRKYRMEGTLAKNVAIKHLEFLEDAFKK